MKKMNILLPTWLLIAIATMLLLALISLRMS